MGSQRPYFCWETGGNFTNKENVAVAEPLLQPTANTSHLEVTLIEATATEPTAKRQAKTVLTMMMRNTFKAVATAGKAKFAASSQVRTMLDFRPIDSKVELRNMCCCQSNSTLV
jgi:hypothetical protein